MYKNVFDRAFRKGEGEIENVFAYLKNSWKNLKCLNLIIPYVGQIIVACCILYKFCRINNQQLSSGKIMDAHPNLNDFRVSRRPATKRLSRPVTIAIRHAIYEKWLDFI